MNGFWYDLCYLICITESIGHFEIFAFVQNDDGVVPALACKSGDPEGLYKDFGFPFSKEMTIGMTGDARDE